MTGESSSSNRWSHWFGTLAFSIVALVSLTTSWTGDLKSQVGDVKWVFSAIITAVCLSGLAVVAHGAKDKFIGTPIEVGLASIVMAIMAAALPAIMKPGNEIAVNRNGVINNANLYFFSWGAFFTALFAIIHIMQNVYNVGAGTRNTKFTRTPWILLIATSLIAMSSAARIWKSRTCQDLDSPPCRRLEYAFSLGAISGVLSFIWLLLGARFHTKVDAFVSLLMLVLWCFAVGYTTFGDAAPALNLGNLYFSSWISFVICCRLVSVAIHNTVTSMTEAEGGDSAKVAEEVAPKEAEAEGGDSAKVAEEVAPKEAEVKDDDKNKDDKAAAGDEEAGSPEEQNV